MEPGEAISERAALLAAELVRELSPSGGARRVELAADGSLAHVWLHLKLRRPEA